MSSLSTERPVSVSPHDVMIARRAESPCCLIIGLGQNCLLINGEVLRQFMRGKKSPQAGVLGGVLPSIWKGGFHEYPTRSTVQPTAVPGGGDARGASGTLGPPSQ